MKKWMEGGFAAAFLLVLLAVPLGTFLWSHKASTAYYENRALAAKPALSSESLWTGSYGEEAEKWYSDHAPGRTTLLKADTWAQMELLGRIKVRGVVDGGDVLLPFCDYPTGPKDFADAAETMSTRYQHLHEHIQERGGAFYFVGLPEQSVYFNDRYPTELYDRKAEMEEADRVFLGALREKGIPVIDMQKTFDALGKPEEFYSRVDHHYTFYGAYAAYRQIMDTLRADGWELPVLMEEDLDFRVLPNPYIGSRSRKIYHLWAGGEQPVIGVQKDPVPFARWDNGQPSDKPLYITYEDPSQPTTYNLYMGGDFGETVLETNRPELPNALIFGDSFTNAMEPLLYTAFNETRTLDLRHYQEKSLGDYISDYQPDIVICVSNDIFYYTSDGNGAVWPDA